MVKLGIIQTKSYESNEKGIRITARMLKSLGHKDANIVCMPEQWLKNNRITDFEKELKEIRDVAKEYSMTIIPGAFYERRKHRFAITAPVIGEDGEIIGKQDKIHPFDYERDIVNPGKKTNVFKTSCKFGIIVCYDMVFPRVANVLAKKGAEVLFSPSRIVKRGIFPWHLYVQTRALENRIPILAANVENNRFGGSSIIVDLRENNGVIIPKNHRKLKGQSSKLVSLNLSKFQKSRRSRYSDARSFT